MNARYLLGKLTPFVNKRNMLVENQKTTDIIKKIIDTHNRYKSDYDKISNHFWKGNVKNTCKYLFYFLKKNVKYSIEPDTRQSVKSPAAILATGKFSDGGNDCKHYSLFQAGILDSLKRSGKNIDWCYRFANYKLFSSVPHHVFIVVKINGIEYWCDPVLDTWNEHKPYINKIDKNMSLYSISGIGARRTKAQRKAARTQRRSARSGGEGCKGRTAAKIALSVPRRAFLALVRLNVKKFALKLYKALNDPKKRPALLAKWCQLGGNAKLLETTVNKAVAKYKRKNPGASIGVAVEALITSATPIIIALLKFMGGRSEEIEEPGMEAPADQQEQPAQEQETVGAINPYLLYGGIALAGYFLLSNKKLFK